MHWLAPVNSSPKRINRRLKRYLLALGIGIVSVAASAALAERWDNVGYLLAPGLFLAAFIFPQGIHDLGGMYLITALILNIAAYAGLALLIMGALRRFRRAIE